MERKIKKERINKHGKKKVEEMTAEQVATGTLENEVAEGANEKATAVEYNYPDIIREELIKTGRDGVLDLIEYMRECGFFEAPASGGNHSHEKGGLAAHSVNVMFTAEKSVSPCWVVQATTKSKTV